MTKGMVEEQQSAGFTESTDGCTESGEREIGRESYDFREVRYYYEHRLLPDWFYNGTDRFAGSIQKGKGYFLYGVMSLLCKENGQKMQFTEEQYKVVVCKSSKDVSMIRIEMPKPEEQCGCYQVYLVFSEDYQDKRYFTVERGASSRERFYADGICRETIIIMGSVMEI